MVIVLSVQVAETPAGRPFAPGTPLLEMPVAPLVACVIAVNVVLIHNVGVDDPAPAVIFGFTVMVPVALTLPQPPVRGML